MCSKYSAALMLAAMSWTLASVSADELWRQNPINSFSGLSSQDARNAGGLGWFAEVVDDFTANDTWTIETVQFWGGYPQIAPGNTQGFMIRFYENTSGTVGALVDTQDVTTFSEVHYYVHPSLGFPGYHYTLDLNTPVTVAPGDYWVSVVAILDRGAGSTEPQWGWVDAQSLQGSGAMQRFFSPVFNLQPHDVAFVLDGSVGGCYADCDGNGTLNVFDYICFGNAYSSNDPYADCDGNSTFNVFDYICFGNSYAAGCP